MKYGAEEINDLLIILALSALMLLSPQADIVSTIVGGFLGYMVKSNQQKGGSNGST